MLQICYTLPTFPNLFALYLWKVSQDVYSLQSLLTLHAVGCRDTNSGVSPLALVAGHIWPLRRAAAQDRHTAALRRRAAGRPEIAERLHGLRMPQFRDATRETSQCADYVTKIFSACF
jgi:hypothetical protein